MYEFTIEDIEALTLGATLLGTGGGGDPYIARLMVHQAIHDHGPVQMVNAEDLPPEARILTTAVVGAPTVIVEKIPAGTEFVGAVRALAGYLGEKPAAIMPVEVGGMNTLIPLAVAAELGVPVVNADGMRRAFPQIEMTVFTLGNITASPLSVADEKGNRVVMETTSNQVAEKLVRGTVMMLGMANALSCYPMTAAQVVEHGIRGSLEYCVTLGRLLGAVQRGEDGAWDRFAAFSQARRIFSGKIIDLDRRTTEGFARGTVVVEHFSDPGRTMRIEIQNELLLAVEGDLPIVTPPDLICMLDHENADPITTEALAYGQRVDVISMPCAPEWHREGFLDIVGPRAFGYDLDYVPFGGEQR